MKSITVEVPSESIGEIGDRLTSHGYEYERNGETLTVLDPWGNQVSIEGDATRS